MTQTQDSLRQALDRTSGETLQDRFHGLVLLVLDAFSEVRFDDELVAKPLAELRALCDRRESEERRWEKLNSHAARASGHFLEDADILPACLVARHACDAGYLVCPRAYQRTPDDCPAWIREYILAMVANAELVISRHHLGDDPTGSISSKVIQYLNADGTTV